MTGARPMVFVSLEPWDDVWRRNQHLVTRLRASGAVGDVLYVEPSVDPLHTALHRKRPHGARGLRPLLDQPGVTLFETAKALPRRIDPRQDRRWARAVARSARHLELQDPVLWVNDPRGAELLRLMGGPALYDITDDWLLAPRPPAELARLRAWETRLLDECGTVVVCSPGLERSKSAIRPVTLIPNAVDAESYLVEHPRPADLPHTPTALYAGTLHRDRLDVELCCVTARCLGSRGGSLVFVGPNALSDADTAQLSAAGAVLLGARPAAQVPAYLQHADVLVVPHLITPFTESLDPIKAYEYAAAGRPVVSTRVAGFRDRPGTTVATVADFPAVAAGLMVDRRAGTPVDGIPTWQEHARRFEELLAELER